MSLRAILGVAVVIAALILAPLSIIGGMWWVVTVLLIVAGTRLYLSARVVRREKQSGGELDDMARGHSISLRRHRGSWESDGAVDGDSD
jgi:membrane protein implicated in regulation of membrane protease activity